MQSNKSPLQSHNTLHTKPETSNGESPHPKNTLNDLGGAVIASSILPKAAKGPGFS